MSTPNLRPLALKLAAASIGFGVLLFGQHPVRAQSQNGALVVHGCPDTTTFYGKSVGYTYKVCADIVFTPSGNVNATLHGALLDVSAAPSRAVVVRNFPCEYKGQLTTDSQIVITPNGNVNGYCELHTH